MRMLRPAQNTAFWSRLGITLAVLAAYYLGTNVPLPGLDAAQVGDLAQSSGIWGLKRLSIFSLGIMPLINALILLEILKLFVPDVRRWEHASPRNRDRLALVAVGLALIMGLIQGAGIASALEDVAGLVVQPGTVFRATCIATLLAGTATAIAFTGLIDRIGVGCGLWLVFLTPALAAMPSTLAQLAVLTAQGRYTSDAILFSGVYSALAIAAVIGIVLAARASRATVETCTWTPFVAGALATMPLIAVGWFATSSIDGAVGLALPGQPLWYAGLTISVVVTVWLYARSFARAGEANPVSPAPVAASLAAILIAGALLESQLGVLLPLRSTELIVVAAVASTLLIRWGFIADQPETAQPD